MDNSKAEVSRDDVQRAVKQGILLNEHLLRRAWGVLYVVLAFSMFISSFGVPILEVAKLVGLPGSMATTMTASGSALIVILWTFKRVGYSADVTHPVDIPAWPRLLGWRFLVPLWIATNVVALSTLVFVPARTPLVVFLIRLGLVVYLYYAMRLSFSRKIPGEAVVAIGSLALGSVASIALLSMVLSPGPYALIAGATIVAWVVSGVFALTRPIPEFEEEHTGLE